MESNGKLRTGINECVGLVPEEITKVAIGTSESPKI